MCYLHGQVAQHAADAIQMDYGEDADTLFASMHFLNRDVIRRKLARAILLPYGDGDKQSEGVNPFVIAFAGTSVTAGHDNFFNQSYPLVFGRELNTSFSAAGIDLVIRNHAMGNNPTVPSCFLVETQLGLDTDVAVWEFGMMASGMQAVKDLEIWMRNALSLPKQPAVMVLDDGGTSRVPNENETPLAENPSTPDDWSRQHTDSGRSLLWHYERFGVHAQVSC
jgi:hypothetical protein